MSDSFRFQSGKGHYQADACVVWCFDNRFWQLFLAFLKERGLVWFDPVLLAGGAKSLASADGDGRVALEQIQTSLRLHRAPRIILMTHSDCGGYGGLQAFHNDPVAERVEHEGDLRRAAEAVRKIVPESVLVEAYFADFEGLHPVS